MATTRYFFQASQEHFPPEDLLRQAVEAEQHGFDGIASSDHLQPWWEGGESGHTWPWLGAVGQATSTILLGTGWGEALKEVPVGAPWPSPGEQVARMDGALDIIDRLWRGETVTQDGGA